VKLSTLRLLARPKSPADRSRARLLAAGVAAGGALLIGAGRIARFDGAEDGTGVLAPFVAEPGLRPGVVLGALLLLVPVLALTVQALRIGALARDRRLAALRLAGATPAEVRTVAAAEAGTAATVGGLLAGPGYLLLWLVLGALVPPGFRLLPVPEPADVLVWALVVALAAAGGALAGAFVQRRLIIEPLGVRRRHRRPPARRRGLAAFALAVIIVVLVVPRVVFSSAVIATYEAFVPVALGVFVVLLLALVMMAGTQIALATGRRLRRRGGPAELLASAQLHTDPGAAGRVAAVLFICGLSLGIDVVLIVSMLTEGRDAYELAFYLVGMGLVAAAVVVAAVVATLTLALGVADQLLDARRALASLAALGVEEQTLVRALHRQLAASAVPAIASGVLLGALFLLGPSVLSLDGRAMAATAAVLGTAFLAALGVDAMCRLLARCMRGRVRAAVAPENLRVA
jgi:hypothetical protein